MNSGTTPQRRGRLTGLIVVLAIFVLYTIQTWLIFSRRVDARALLSAEGLVGVAVGALVALLGMARTWGWPLPLRLRVSSGGERIAWRLVVVGALIIALGVITAWPLRLP